MKPTRRDMLKTLAGSVAWPGAATPSASHKPPNDSRAGVVRAIRNEPRIEQFERLAYGMFIIGASTPSWAGANGS